MHCLARFAKPAERHASHTRVTQMLLAASLKRSAQSQVNSEVKVVCAELIDVGVYSPLIAALLEDELEIAKVLIAKGADVNFDLWKVCCSS